MFTSRHDTNDLAEAIEISKTLDWKSRSVTDWLDGREFTQWTANLGYINLIVDRFDGSDKCNLYVWHSNSYGSGDLARKIGYKGSLESAQAAAMMLMQTYCKRAFDTINMLNVSRISKVSERAFKDLNEYRSSDASGFNHFLAGIAVGGSTFISTVVSILGYENDRTPSNS